MSYSRLPFGTNRCRPVPLCTRWEAGEVGADTPNSSVMISTLDDESQQSLPVPEQLLVADLRGIGWVVGPVLLGLAAASHPVVAGAHTGGGGLDVHVVGPAGRPVVATAFAVVVLPGR